MRGGLPDRQEPAEVCLADTFACAAACICHSGRLRRTHFLVFRHVSAVRPGILRNSGLRDPNSSKFGGHMTCLCPLCPPNELSGLPDALNNRPRLAPWQTDLPPARLASASRTLKGLFGGHLCPRRVLCPPPGPNKVCLADTYVRGWPCVRHPGPKRFVWRTLMSAAGPASATRADSGGHPPLFSSMCPPPTQ